MKKNAIGRSRGGNSTKIHVLANSRGMPLHVEISPGQQHDVTMAEALLEHAIGDACVADSAYDSRQFIEAIEAKGMTAVIENHPNRKFPRPVDKDRYSLRYKVECCFHVLKRCRRIATRYEKTARNFLAFVHVACSMAWLGSLPIP